MDRNTITGLVLIFLILITFSYFNKPSQKEIDAMKQRRDSIARVEADRAAEAAKLAVETKENIVLPTDTTIGSVENQLRSMYGAFGVAAQGEEKFVTIENNLMKVTLSTKGGKIYAVELKGYKRYNGEPLVLFEGDSNQFGLNFFSQNKSIKTDNFYFQPSVNENISIIGPEIPTGKEGRENYNENHQGETKSLAMKLDAGDDVSIEYVYSLKHNSYMVGFEIQTNNLKKVAGSNTDYVNFAWAIEMPRQEKMSKFGENRYTTIYYKFNEDEVDNINPEKSESKTLSTRVKWISFKQQFFSSIFIAESSFLNGQVSTQNRENDPKYVANVTADVTIPVDAQTTSSFPARFYFGPNQYNTLRQYHLDFDEELALGWTIIGWVNKYIVIPAFDFLRRYIGNFGLIILLLTIYIKIIIVPFTYKSYISQAKMKLLKPEIDEIQKKYPEDKKMEAQQAVMGLYRKAGVNPLGGCLPLLFQMPILISMFYFFPISIELRQESFLWASDLSTYDSIFTLPFTIPFYGNHVSLFCLLMTVANILYVKYNNEMNTAGSQQMPGMKTVMYMMPVMFLFIFNSYAAGLSLYYFLSLILSFVQMYIFKISIDEKAIHEKLKAKQKMPVKKSKFQERLEEMAKQQKNRK